MLDSIMTREELYKDCEILILTFKTKYSLDELISDYEKVYFNLSGDNNRMKIMANQMYTGEDGYVKSKTFQIYGLLAKERKISSSEELYQVFSNIKRFCYSIQQIKAIDTLIEVNSRIVNSNDLNELTKIEIDKMKVQKRRRKNHFFK